MSEGQLRKCQSCRTTAPRDSLPIFTAPGLSLRVCRQCYLKLVEKYLGYSQGELELVKQKTGPDEDLPF